MDVDYKALAQFCQSEAQIKLIETLIKVKSQEKAAKALGKNKRSVSRMVSSIRRNAASKGYDPENGLNRPVSNDMAWRGTSTLYDEDGGVKLQWVKSKPNADNEAEALKEFVAGLMADVPKYKPAQQA